MTKSPLHFRRYSARLFLPVRGVRNLYPQRGFGRLHDKAARVQQRLPQLGHDVREGQGNVGRG